MGIPQKNSYTHNTLLKGLILLTTIILLSTISIAHAKEGKMMTGKRLVVIIKTDNVGEAGMGLSLAESGLRLGGEVTVVLGAGASTYPLLNGGQEIFAAKEMTPREMLTRIIERGGAVYICELCADFKGFTEKNLLNGVKIVKSNKIFAKMYEDNVRIMSY